MIRNLHNDSDAIWKILEPVIRGGDTYTLPADMSREDALAYWQSPGHEVFVAEENGDILGNVFFARKSEGRRSTRCELRIYDCSLGQRKRRCAGDVPTFAGICEGARFPRDAIQFRGEQQRARGTVVAEPWVLKLSAGFRKHSCIRTRAVDVLVMYRQFVVPCERGRSMPEPTLRRKPAMRIMARYGSLPSAR